MPRFKGRIRSLTLVPSKGGCFELSVGDRLVYSKLKTGQFPDNQKLAAEVGRLLGA